MKFFAFIVVLVFELLRRQVSFIKRKENRNCLKVGVFLKNNKFHGKITAKLYIHTWAAKFSGYF